MEDVRKCFERVDRRWRISSREDKECDIFFFWTMMNFGSFVLKLEFDDHLWPDYFLGFECNYFEYPSRFRTERGRSRDWCTRSYLKFHGSYLFLVLAG